MVQMPVKVEDQEFDGARSVAQQQSAHASKLENNSVRAGDEPKTEDNINACDDKKSGDAYACIDEDLAALLSGKYMFYRASQFWSTLISVAVDSLICVSPSFVFSYQD